MATSRKDLSFSVVNTGTAAETAIVLDGTGLRGVVAVNHNGSNNVTLCGSLDGTTYYVIETFTASTLKEITLCPYFKVNGAADTTMNDTIGSSTCTIFTNEALTRTPSGR